MGAPIFPSFPSSDGSSSGVLLPYAMPLAIPAGIPSWELTTVLPSDREATERVPLKFSTPFVLTGILPTIVALDGDGVPREISPQHLWVTLDIDKRVYVTVEGTVTSNNSPGQNWVTLEAVSVLVRLYNLHLRGATPEIGASFRSKHASAGSNGFGYNLRICLTAFGYECDHDGNPIPLVR